jgi:hypothetical protein
MATHPRASSGLTSNSKNRKESTDDTRNAVETFALVVGTFHGIGFREVYPFGHPAFRAVGKRRGFHKGSSNPKLTAVNAEPAVLNRFFFLRQALHPAFYCRQDPGFIFSHRNVSCCILLSPFDIIPLNDGLLSGKYYATLFNSGLSPPLTTTVSRPANL